jgi:Arf-GAP/coiled-coil/ANK repeat/PH domain-containing protein
MASPFESVEDSPFLRAQLRSLDEGVDELRERTARLSKGCSAYRDGLEDAYANEVNFAESVRAFHGPLDDPFGAQVGASEIDRLLGAFRDIADARGALLSAVETDLCARLETMVSVDLRDATEAKRRFERCSAEHERARAHFLKLTKDAKPETLRLAEAEMTQARREHDAARFGLMSRLHEADSRKRVAFKRQIAVAVDAHRAFFERGFRALAELEPFVRQVVARCAAAGGRDGRAHRRARVGDGAGQLQKRKRRPARSARRESRAANQPRVGPQPRHTNRHARRRDRRARRPRAWGLARRRRGCVG